MLGGRGTHREYTYKPERSLRLVVMRNIVWLYTASIHKPEIELFVDHELPSITENKPPSLNDSSHSPTTTGGTYPARSLGLCSIPFSP